MKLTVGLVRKSKFKILAFVYTWALIKEAEGHRSVLGF
jgi:hypothetical protein